jgi:hypothetical protein
MAAVSQPGWADVSEAAQRRKARMKSRSSRRATMTREAGLGIAELGEHELKTEGQPRDVAGVAADDMAHQAGLHTGPDDRPGQPAPDGGRMNARKVVEPAAAHASLASQPLPIVDLIDEAVRDLG